MEMVTSIILLFSVSHTSHTWSDVINCAVFTQTAALIPFIDHLLTITLYKDIGNALLVTLLLPLLPFWFLLNWTFFESCSKLAGISQK